MSLAFNPTGYAATRLMGNSRLGELVSLLGLDAGNAPVLLMLGSVKFSLNTVVFSALSRQNAANWAAVPRIGQLDALQYTGPGPEIIELPGKLYPDFRGSTRALDALRSMMRAGGAYHLISANGLVFGTFIILAIRDDHTYYKANGAARCIEFSISLRRFDEAPNAEKQALSLARMLGDVKDAIGQAQDTLQNTVSNDLNKAGTETDTLTNRLNDVFG